MSMFPVGWRLGRRGFRCTRLSYPATRQRLDASIDHVGAQIARIDGPVAIVGHSLGGLIGAALLRRGDLPITHVVQLGSPNLGSPAADRLAGTWPVRRFCGPVLEDLGVHEEALPDHPQIGAIAGFGGPTLPGIDLPEPHDGVVSQISAWAGAGERTSTSSLHSFLPSSGEVARLTSRFLITGTFAEAPS